MKLRTQILLFVFLFALTPLLTAVVINLPLVLERMELFYQKAHLQNLRADFRDLDQHLASRNEMVRLLAKLPEPGLVLGIADNGQEENIDQARTRYIQWINRILNEQLDIIQIVFLGREGKELFWLEREQKSQLWQPTTRRPTMPADNLIQSAINGAPGHVMVSAIRLNPAQAQTDPRRFMTLNLITPIYNLDSNIAIGSVMISIDVGGMATGNRDTLWVKNNGEFLAIPNARSPADNAFAYYPGLDALFKEEKPVLWKDAQTQIMWVPMFRTEEAEALWVGRLVDPSPIDEFRQALTLRVLSIVFLLTLVTWLASRWFARRAERISQQLTAGIQHILEDDQVVEFNWRGPQELQRLGQSLSRLAATHGRNTKNLRAHARELEQSNRYKSEFLANISHELKTPLNSILLLSKMLADEKSGLPPEQARQASVINEAGRDLQHLIDNILDLSRIEARRTPVNIEQVQLVPLLESLVELVKPQFDAKGLQLQLAIANEAPLQIKSDADKIRQILKNFLSNAVKFTLQGSVELRLDVSSDRTDLKLSVQDSGIGIPADQQAHIFEAFRQAEGATNRRFGGTGLGLTISRQLAHLLGGEITLESTEQQGSLFTLCLPLQAVKEPAARPSATENLPANEESEVDHRMALPGLGPHHILVVDSKVEGLLELIPLLESWQLKVTAAGDRTEALEVLAEERSLQLVIISIRQPELAACDTIQMIKAASGAALLALLSDDSDTTIDRYQAAGADSCLLMPPDPQLLHARLSSLLPVVRSDQ